MRCAVRVILAASLGAFFGCPAGAPDAGAADAGGQRPLDAGPTVRITHFEAIPVPLDDVIDVRWQSEGATGCTLEEERGAITATTLPPAGEEQIAADFEAAGFELALTLRCEGPAGATSSSLSGDVPHITRFDATPSAVAAGEETVLCWALEGGVEPVCAIFAIQTGEYYYPLEAADCLFPLVLEANSSFLLYCSPTNGYVEQELTVALHP